MRIIICATILPPEVELRLPGASPAAGKYLRNLEKAFTGLGHQVIEMSYVAIPGAKEMCSELGADDRNIVYKDRFIVPSVKEYQKRVLETAHEGDVVIFYNIVYYDLGLVSKLNKRGIKSLLILADYTGDMKENGSFIRGMLAKRVLGEFRKFKYAVALSERAKKLLASDASVEIIEGGIDMDAFFGFESPGAADITRYMYAGTINNVTGVDILLDAIRMSDDEKSEFYISGKGDLEQAVKEAAKNDTRIKYIGFIPDDEYYQLMQKMDVFINPRNMDLDQNQNNFPSKVLEYLATGRTVISTRFPGWEKFTDCFSFCDHNPEALYKGILEAKELSPQNRKERFEHNRERAKDYDWNSQAVRKIELID